MALFNKNEALQVIAITKVNPIAISKIAQGRYFVQKDNDLYRYLKEVSEKSWKVMTSPTDCKEGQRTICFNEVKNRKDASHFSTPVNDLFINSPIGTAYVLDVDKDGRAKFVTGELTEQELQELEADTVKA